MGLAAAIAVGAVGSVAAAGIGASASSNAAKTQANAENNASAEMEAQYQQTRSDLMPYQTAGQAAIPSLESMAPYSPGAAFNFSPTEAQLEATPGYQFNLDQGLKATQNSAASRGLAVSGAAEKGAASYASGLADTTYQNQFTNALNSYTTNVNTGLNAYTTNLNKLQNQANMGENAAAQTGSYGTTTAANIGQTAVGAANAQAAGDVGVANAASSGISGLSSAFLMNQFLSPSSMFGSGAGALGGASTLDMGFANS